MARKKRIEAEYQERLLLRAAESPDSLPGELAGFVRLLQTEIKRLKNELAERLSETEAEKLRDALFQARTENLNLCANLQNTWTLVHHLRHELDCQKQINQLDKAYLRMASPVAPIIPENVIKQLRSLCHPDRWDGAPQERMANEVSQWLNTLVK